MRGWPVASNTARQRFLSGSTRLRWAMANSMGTCTYWLFQSETIMPVLPASPACTALWPKKPV